MQNESYTDKQVFVLKMAEKAHEMERERSKNLLNQSQRLLPMQTFLLTALTFVYPIIKELKDANESVELSKYVFFLTIVFFLISLALNLASQWGFKINTFPIPSQVETSIDKYLRENKLEYNLETEYTAIKDLWNEVVKDLRKFNNIKAGLLCFSMIGLLLSIASFIWFVFPLILIK